MMGIALTWRARVLLAVDPVQTVQTLSDADLCEAIDEMHDLTRMSCFEGQAYALLNSEAQLRFRRLLGIPLPGALNENGKGNCDE